MFFHQQNDEININNQVRLTVGQFRLLEPTYPSLPEGYTERFYQTGVRHNITGEGRIPINDSIFWSDGDRFFARIQEFIRMDMKFEAYESAIRENVQRELDKRKPHSELRLREYPPIQELIVALWENIVEKRGFTEAGIEAIQQKRLAVKTKYPKKRS